MKLAKTTVKRLKFRIRNYTLFADSLEEFLLRQGPLVESLSLKLEISTTEVRKLIAQSSSIVAFSVLVGTDLGGVKGAVTGGVLAAVVVIGNVTVRIYIFKNKHGPVFELKRRT